MEPLTGPIPVPGPGGCQEERFAIALEFRHLSAVFRNRGVDSLGVIYGNMADLMSSDK